MLVAENLNRSLGILVFEARHVLIGIREQCWDDSTVIKICHIHQNK